MTTKIELDKYYTPPEIAQHTLDKIYEIIGRENIDLFLEPSAGDGVFLNILDQDFRKNLDYNKSYVKPYEAYDIAPEDNRISKMDFLSYKNDSFKRICAIGNPPFGDRKNNLVRKFFSVLMNNNIQYVAFILPIRQYKNEVTFYEYDLIYTEDLGTDDYSGISIHCCLNIYKRPETLNKKKNYELQNVKIEEHHRTNNPLLNNISDYRICSFGNIGKIVEYPNRYCKELCINVSDRWRNEVISLLSKTDFHKEFPSVSSPYVAKWQIYKYIKENIPEIE